MIGIGLFLFLAASPARTPPPVAEFFPDLALRYQTFEIVTEENEDPVDHFKKMNDKKKERFALRYIISKKRIPLVRDSDPLGAAIGRWVSRSITLVKFYDRYRNQLRIIPQVRIQVQDPRLGINDPIVYEEFESWITTGLFKDLSQEEKNNLSWKVNPERTISNFIVEHGWWPRMKAPKFETRMAAYIGTYRQRNKGIGNHFGVFPLLTSEAQQTLIRNGFSLKRRMKRPCDIVMQELTSPSHDNQNQHKEPHQ